MRPSPWVQYLRPAIDSSPPAASRRANNERLFSSHPNDCAKSYNSATAGLFSGANAGFCAFGGAVSSSRILRKSACRSFQGNLLASGGPDSSSNTVTSAGVMAITVPFLLLFWSGGQLLPRVQGATGSPWAALSAPELAGAFFTIFHVWTWVQILFSFPVSGDHTP